MPTSFTKQFGLRGDIIAHTFGEAAGQTYKRGDFVYLVSGLVTQRYALSTASTAGDVIAGVALADATGVTSASAPIAVFLATTEILLPVASGTLSTSYQSYLAAHFGNATPYRLTRVASGVYTVDTSATAPTQLLIPQEVEPGTTNTTIDPVALYWCRVQNANRQLG